MITLSLNFTKNQEGSKNKKKKGHSFECPMTLLVSLSRASFAYYLLARLSAAILCMMRLFSAGRSWS